MNRRIKNTMKFSLVLSIFVLIFIQNVESIGVTEPSPVNLKLSRGESARFKFQIQAVTSDLKQSCTYTITGLNPLVITYDEEKAVINAGGVKDVFGDFFVPEDAPIKRYNGKVTVKCLPMVEESNSFIHELIDVNFDIDVIGDKGEVTTTTKEVTPEISEEEKLHLSLLERSYILLIFVMTIVLIISFYILFKRKKIRFCKAI